MRINKTDIPVEIDAPGAVARHAPGFGQGLAAEFFSLGAGFDLAPMLEGLHENACPAAHGGYGASGDVTGTYTDGTHETCVAGDLFYWPAGHSIRAGVDAEIVLFSEQAEHRAVIDHIQNQATHATGH
ncbi:MAG: cupin domain-containing protein [Actinomycetia bacterium]|nr:cupin domain-containing protein [Actinomycetes bacterium]